MHQIKETGKWRSNISAHVIQGRDSKTRSQHTASVYDWGRHQTAVGICLLPVSRQKAVQREFCFFKDLKPIKDHFLLLTFIWRSKESPTYFISFLSPLPLLPQSTGLWNWLWGKVLNLSKCSWLTLLCFLALLKSALQVKLPEVKQRALVEMRGNLHQLVLWSFILLEMNEDERWSGHRAI